MTESQSTDTNNVAAVSRFKVSAATAKVFVPNQEPASVGSESTKPEDATNKANSKPRNRRKRGNTPAKSNKNETADETVKPASKTNDQGSQDQASTANKGNKPKQSQTKKTKPNAKSSPKSGAKSDTKTDTKSEAKSEPAPEAQSQPADAQSKPRKKSQRRAELDSLKRKFKVIQIYPDIYQVLLTPSDPDFALPVTVLDFDMIIPRHYPREPASIKINNTEIPRGYALNVEIGFRKLEGTLLEKTRLLDQKLEDFLTSEPQQTIKLVKSVKRAPVVREAGYVEPLDDVLESQDGQDEPAPALTDDYDLSDSDDTEPESGSTGSEDGETEDAAEAADNGRPVRRGTELVLPDIALSNIALLEISSLNLLIKCGRCKHLNEFRNLLSGPYAQESKPRTQGCEKCSLGLMVAFRKEFLHSFSTTAGFLDISGGGFADLLPSSFVAVCGNCNESNSLFKSVDFGKTATHACRDCHTKMSITMDQFRFDLITTDTLGPTKDVSGSKDNKLRLQGGQPLAGLGTCRHYRKSQRWFRFSCCRKVFPCDRCHDEVNDHPVEPALRMICGHCSREQRFSDMCMACGHSFSVRHSAFWEGGRGTRDKTRMSKKDPHKYKRLGAASA